MPKVTPAIIKSAAEIVAKQAVKHSNVVARNESTAFDPRHVPFHDTHNTQVAAEHPALKANFAHLENERKPLFNPDQNINS